MIITIDANIGAGKSTVMEWLKREKGCTISVEPVDKWTPYLHEMYHLGRGVFEFQVRVWLDRGWPDTNEAENRIVVMERSPLFQKKVFIPINAELNRLTAREAHSLSEMYDITFNLWQPDKYIYLRSNPEKCAERILRRCRDTEADIPLSYLRRLHELHESTYEWIDQLNVLNESNADNESRIAVIDVEGKSVADIGAAIWNFISKTTSP